MGDTETKSTSPLRFDRSPLNNFNLISQIDILNKTMQELVARVYVIEKKMDSQDQIIFKEIKSIKKSINTLSQNMNMDPRKKSLKEWMENKVQLPEFYDLFIENAIDDLETVKLLTKEELKEIGIQKIGHLKKILREITFLNQKQNGIDEGKENTFHL